MSFQGSNTGISNDARVIMLFEANKKSIGVTYLLWFLLALFFLVNLGFLRGTAGPNRYGPDPLA